MAQLHHHEIPSQRFLQDYGSSDEKQCHDHDQRHQLADLDFEHTCLAFCSATAELSLQIS
jgi:hypothetical protein